MLPGVQAITISVHFAFNKVDRSKLLLSLPSLVVSTLRDQGNGISSCCQQNAWRWGIINSSNGSNTANCKSLVCVVSDREYPWNWVLRLQVERVRPPVPWVFLLVLFLWKTSGGANDRSTEVTSNSLAYMPAWVQTSWLRRRNEDADLTFYRLAMFEMLTKTPASSGYASIWMKGISREA